ncbi:hypothetical protein [Wenzhouxiangella sp. EGI_FJ10409]|uniref:hypothetical protein n=1 Tax=Wenzhouxiangella sp. EGI_FJ10409 TaxID=3243767 RepID=UPI0035D6ED9A
MKRLLLFIVIGLVVVLVGANWYYTGQIRDQLDRMASGLSMFGTLSYDNVRLSPGGAININDLSFRLHQGRGGIDVGQISLQTANLLALLTLESNLERGQIPETLSLRVDNLQFPLDGELATMARQASGSNSPMGASGVLFNAAGCDGRTQFDSNDLLQMDYFDIRADVEARYQLLDNGDRLRLFVNARTHEASAIFLEATFDLQSASLTASELAGSMQNTRLGSFSLEYEDLGFYERMLAFCADEMSMTKPEYIAHHLEAWEQAWSRFNAEPGPDTVAAYESFLEDPQQFSVSTDAEHSVSIERIEHYAISELLDRMKVRLVVNYGDPQPLDISVLEQSSAPIASPEQPARDEDEAAAPESEDVQTATTTDGADADTPEQTPDQPLRQWITIDPGALESHRDKRLRVRMESGDQHSGRLADVDPDHIHIRVESTGGFYIRPLAREEIREVEVYEGS